MQEMLIGGYIVETSETTWWTINFVLTFPSICFVMKNTQYSHLLVIAFYYRWALPVRSNCMTKTRRPKILAYSVVNSWILSGRADFMTGTVSPNTCILLQLNLASQSVLEGLNACLDHRAEIFIPELGRSFAVQAGKTRLFACQNPVNQGGGRKGLPKSFLNRFTQVSG